MASKLYLQYDFHVHTRHSPCANNDMSPTAIVRMAKANGTKYLGMTDHLCSFTDPTVLTYARAECPPSNGSPEIFFGCEVDVLSVGSTCLDNVRRPSLDYIVLAASHFYNPGVARPASEDPKAVGRHFLEMFHYAATVDYADVIAHPFYVMPDTYDVNSIYTLTDNDLKPAVESAAANGVAVEISRRAVTPDHIEFMGRFYRLCKDAGVKFAIGTDSHSLSAVGRTEMLAPLIEQLGLEDEDFWLPRKNGGTEK